MTRLNKHIARILGISRREADGLIDDGKVTVDGKVAQLGEQPDQDARVTVNGQEINKSTATRLIALHKPTGYVCSRKQQGDSPTIYDLLPSELQQLKTVGRLDRDSSGIILLTNDGDFAHIMTHPKFSKVKIYEVELDKSLQPLHQQMISDYGVQLDDGTSKFIVEKISDRSANTVFSEHLQPISDQTSGPSSDVVRSSSEKTVFAGNRSYTVTMKEGRNRQIRRTFDSLGYTVTKLHRIQFGNYLLNDLAPKQWRELST